MTTKVHVMRVQIPAGSTLGFGQGISIGDDGQLAQIHFVGDHRAMLEIGKAIARGDDEEVWAVVEDHNITWATPVISGQA